MRGAEEEKGMVEGRGRKEGEDELGEGHERGRGRCGRGEGVGSVNGGRVSFALTFGNYDLAGI